MPFGFADYRIRKGIKAETVKFQVITINQFLSYLDYQNPEKKLELTEIEKSHIAGYLKQQLEEKNLDESTVYRKQSTLRVFFDFLYNTDQILLDPMVKFNYFADKTVDELYKKEAYATKLDYDYQFLLDKKHELFSMPRVALKTKLLYILVLRGIQLSDLYRLQTNNFYTDSNDHLILKFVTKFKKQATVIFDEKSEIEVITQAIAQANENNTPYLLHTRKENGTYEASDALNTRYYFVRMQKLLGFSIRSENIRLAYIHYLYFYRSISPVTIAAMMGRPTRNIFKLIDESLERITNTNYNVVHDESSYLVLPTKNYKSQVKSSSEQLNLFNFS